MKQQFSPKWTGSRQPRKQRKYLANAPFHVRHQVMSANLSKELRKKYGKRSFPVRKGDEVKIMVGEYRKKTGKIDIIDMKNYRVTIENIQRTKKDGTKIKVFFHPSNLQIKELNLDDKKRKEALERKTIMKKQETKTSEKPAVKEKETKPKIEKTENKSEEKKEIKKIKHEIKSKQEKHKEAKKNAPQKK